MMASQKDIELILKAKVEQGDSLSQAQSMAKSMADALESAFTGVGERIADKILREMQASFKGMEFGSGYQGATISGANAPSRRESSLDNSIQRGVSTSYKGPIPGQVFNNALPFEPDGIIGNQLDFGEQILYKNQQTINSAKPRTNSYMDSSFSSVSNLYKFAGQNAADLFEPLEGDKAKMAGISQRSAIEADSVIGRLKAYQMAKGLGGDVDRDRFASDSEIDGAQSTLAAAAAGASMNWKNLELVIENLTKELSDNTATLKATDDDRKALASKNLGETQENIRQVKLEQLESKKEERNAAKESAEVATNNSKILDKESTGKDGFLSRNRGGIAGLTAGLAVASTGIREMSNLDFYRDEARTGVASLQKQGLRETMSRDYGSIMATEMLGGQDALTYRSRGNVTGRLAGDVGQGLLSVVGGIGAGALGAVAAPFTGGVSAVAGYAAGAGLIANGMSTISGAYRGYNNIDGMTADENRKHKAMWKDRNQEFVELTGRGMNRARTAFGISQQLGDVEYSKQLYGQGTGMIQKGADAGLDEQAVMQMQSGFAGATDHMYGSQNLMMTNAGMNENFVKMMNMEGRGFTGTSELGAAFYNGGDGTNTSAQERAQDIERAQERALRLTSELRSSYGLTNAQTNSVTDSATQLMNKMGMGSEGFADEYARRTGAAIGQGNHSKSAQGIIEATMRERMLVGLSPETAHKDVAKGRAIDDMNKKLSLGLGQSDKIDMMGSKDIDGVGILGYMRDKKMDIQGSEDYKKRKAEFDASNKDPKQQYSEDMYGESVAAELRAKKEEYERGMLTKEDRSLSNMGKADTYSGVRLIQKTQDGTMPDISIDSKAAAELQTSDKTTGPAADAAKKGMKASATEIEASFKAVDALLPEFGKRIEELATTLNKAITDALKPDEIDQAAASMYRLSEAVKTLKANGIDTVKQSTMTYQQKVQEADKIRARQGTAPGGTKGGGKNP